MSSDYIIIALIWIVGILLFVFLTPKQSRRRLIFATLAFQTIIWFNALIHVQFNFISFPIRDFPKATDILFATEYFLYPLLCGFFLIHQPKKNVYQKYGYLSLFISALVAIDLILVHFTHLITYIHYSWIFKWLIFLGIFMIVNGLNDWFFKDNLLLEAEKRVSQ